MSAHTPGPWENVGKDFAVDFKRDVKRGKWRGIYAGGKLIALVKEPHDACLCAAAPLLLGACERLLSDSMFQDHPIASQMAMDAIAASKVVS